MNQRSLATTTEYDTVRDELRLVAIRYLNLPGAAELSEWCGGREIGRPLRLMVPVMGRWRMTRRNPPSIRRADFCHRSFT